MAVLFQHGIEQPSPTRDSHWSLSPTTNFSPGQLRTTYLYCCSCRAARALYITLFEPVPPYIAFYLTALELAYEVALEDCVLLCVLGPFTPQQYSRLPRTNQPLLVTKPYFRTSAFHYRNSTAHNLSWVSFIETHSGNVNEKTLHMSLIVELTLLKIDRVGENETSGGRGISV